MDRQDGTDALTQFTWERQPEAERLVRELVAHFLAKCPEANSLAQRMHTETGTRFVDWVDYIELPASNDLRQRLARAGYQRTSIGDTSDVFVQPHGVFPRILLKSGGTFDVAIKVDSVADFAAANAVAREPEGPPLHIFRRVVIHSDNAIGFFAVERHGYRSFSVPPFDERRAITRMIHLEAFRTRQRDFAEEGKAFDAADALIQQAIDKVGRDAACDLFFAAEREYWQRRNRAAQFQKARQDRLGLGWANHDHHTYRCSRKHFARLIGLWEKLGFQLRERFYAGAEAGWGAQICEQSNTGIITFNDVDLSPDELFNDFSHEPLPARNQLGTVGLWCALHGESFLQAGMHHLECQFDFDSLKEQMERDANIKVMKPFTDYPYLRQAFTEGERWPVKEERLQALLKDGLITAEQAAQFLANGAIGSHLENLERNEGFKGFNQKGVSDIIAKTDPRKHV